MTAVTVADAASDGDVLVERIVHRRAIAGSLIKPKEDFLHVEMPCSEAEGSC